MPTMTNVRCIIVEDEPLAVERLAGYVRQLPFLELAGTFESALDALAFLRSDPVDLVFLDIRLGGLSGIELLESAALHAQVVLTTAHQEHALRAYDLEVTDYLLKPFTFPRFVQAVDRVRSALPRREPPARKFLFVKTELRLERIALSQIVYIEGVDDFRRIHTTQKRILTPQTFADLERRIPRTLVCRVHRSYMVALDKIESIERDRITIGDVRIPISETYRDAFYALIEG
jgi:two-component system LytT family response regulator